MGDDAAGGGVANHRSLVRLNITAHAGDGHRRQLLLPIPLDGDHVDEVRERMHRPRVGLLLDL